MYELITSFRKYILGKIWTEKLGLSNNSIFLWALHSTAVSSIPLLFLIDMSNKPKIATGIGAIFWATHTAYKNNFSSKFKRILDVYNSLPDENYNLYSNKEEEFYSMSFLVSDKYLEFAEECLLYDLGNNKNFERIVESILWYLHLYKSQEVSSPEKKKIENRYNSILAMYHNIQKRMTNITDDEKEKLQKSYESYSLFLANSPLVDRRVKFPEKRKEFDKLIAEMRESFIEGSLEDIPKISKKIVKLVS